ncbi:MAG: hypothetical protein NVS3B3_07030 [Aquirhabdus sp.]
MRVNTTLQVSRLQKWSEAVAFFLVCSILFFSEMPLWGKGFALIAMGFFLTYQRLLQKPPARLVQLIQFDKENWRWLILEPHRKKKDILEGRLVSVQGGLFVLVLRFETTAKNKAVTQNWVIWHDQVDAANWRRLIVIARFWAEDIQRMAD